MIKSWVFELFVPPAELAQRFDPAVSQRHFNAYLDLWASAEPAGFDGIFFSEHHFGVDLFARRPTSDRQRRAADQEASASASWAWCRPIISRGSWSRRSACSIISPAGGWRSAPRRGIPQEMAQVGLGVDEARARNDEAVEIVDKALAEP